MLYHLFLNFDKKTSLDKALIASPWILLILLQTFAMPGKVRAEVQKKHLGSATCASSNCHGSASAKSGSNVLQNEYVTWYKQEAHSQAWKRLTSKESKIIASHLGIKSPENDPLCLKCHSTYIPKSSQGEKFRIQDGVGCESCHGAAEEYIKSHTSKETSHAQNVANGMTDLVSFSKRAQVCMECHYGTDDQNVNHRLIGAGHPRLTYELDTYGILQPNHWEVDDDYIKRKAAYNSTKAWLVGQIERGIEMSKSMLSTARSRHGALPELSQYYCYNCHHSLTKEQWKSRTYSGRPGELRLNLSSLLISSVAIQAIDKDLGAQLSSLIQSLEISHAKGNDKETLESINSLLRTKIRSLVEATNFSQEIAKLILNEIIVFSTEEILPYETAEQCAMSITAITATLDPKGTKYKKEIDSLYDSLKNEKDFDPFTFRKAAQSML
jgi:Cytochrome c554 and c-prime